MKKNQIRFRGQNTGRKIQETTYVVENPADHELYRLRGLSAEVRAACTTWLVNRGIETRPFMQYPTNNFRV